MKRDYIYIITKVASNIMFGLLSFVIILCLYSFVSLNILSNKYVNFFSYTIFSIGSNSMAPEITTNDLILVKLNKDAKKGDIITFYEDDALVTHRVISKTSNGYVTKGDANNAEDKIVSKNNVIGKTIKILSNYGVWYKVITTPKIIFLICTTLFLFSIAFSYTGKKHLTNSDDFGIYYSGIKLKDKKNAK